MLSKEGAPFKEHRGGPPFSNRKSWNLSIESHEVFRMKIKEKSKVDFNSIRFSFQIHARYRRVDTGSSVYKKIFTPGTITFYCAHRMSVPRQIKVIAKIKLRGFIFPWASFWNALKVVDCCLSINPEAWWEHRPNHKQTILNKKKNLFTHSQGFVSSKKITLAFNKFPFNFYFQAPSVPLIAMCIAQELTMY